MIEHVELEGRKITIVGTAHVSSASVSDARSAIEEHEPDTVCVELDESRLRALREEDEWKSKDVWQTIVDGDAYLLLFNILLGIFQRRIGEEYDVSPGREMLASVEAAEEAGVDVALIDRDINLTLKRAMARLSLLEKYRLLTSMIAGFFESDEEFDIEEFKEKDVLHEVMTDFAGRFPRMKEVLIDERDSYMAEKIRQAPGDRIVAVVGAGHVEGITEQLSERHELAVLEEVPDGFRWYHALKYVFPLFILSMFVYGFFQLGSQVAQDMLLYWIGMNAFLGSLGAVVALAHPLTVLVAGLVAPVASVNPMSPTGLFAAYAENRMRGPRVEDMEGLAEITGYRELWGNRAARLLLVFFLTNLGSSIGSFGAAALLARLSGLV
jgi:pheromone shutdown-related protein TraB